MLSLFVCCVIRPLALEKENGNITKPTYSDAVRTKVGYFIPHYDLMHDIQHITCFSCGQCVGAQRSSCSIVASRTEIAHGHAKDAAVTW